jgi:hypothetical protein
MTNSKTWKQRLLRRLRNSEQGQSILLLALGFIALASFVGLVTDISIMFTRYATLRRAVDSAAVAAAGQMREGTDYGTVALSARQYIKLHGLEPYRVWVETCETDIIEWRKTNPSGAIPDDFKTELCDMENPRKLVKVTAQIDSDTTFLRLLGIETFTLTASATSETAALDVVLILDNSISMADTTNASHYEAINMVNNYILQPSPQTSDFSRNVPDACRFTNYTNSYSRYLNYIAGGMSVSAATTETLKFSTNYNWGGCCNDPAAGAKIYLNTSGDWTIYTDGAVSAGGIAPPGHAPTRQNPPPFQITGANGKFDGSDVLGVTNSIPDNDFSDLICQPFKQIKDAARNFILQMDFARGDRIGFVQFNRLARVLYPNNNSNNPPIMASEEDAVRTLDTYLGVFISPVGTRGTCLAALDANEDVTADVNPQDQAAKQTTVELDYKLRPWSYEQVSQCTNTNTGDGLRQAVGVLADPDTIRRSAVWVAILLSDGAANSSINISPLKARELDGVKTSTPPETILYGDFGFCPWYTFCFHRPGGNFHNTLWYDFTPGLAPDTTSDPLQPGYNRTGWVDYEDIYPNWPFQGEAGYEVAMDAIWLDGVLEVPEPTNKPLRISGVAGTGNNPQGRVNPGAVYPSWAECGPSRNNAATFQGFNRLLNNSGAYYCNDNNPDIRHFCIRWSKDETINGFPDGVRGEYVSGSIVGKWINPDPISGGFPAGSLCARDGLYDADDYARDMADWVGLIEVAPGVPGNFIAIFTIGFGGEILQTTNPSAAPLLRYIADAGDNGVINNNREEDWRDNRAINFGNGPWPDSYGDNDPCYGTTYRNDPSKWCGQYYYANNLSDLEAVFEAIASRLFTRISR